MLPRQRRRAHRFGDDIVGHTAARGMLALISPRDVLSSADDYHARLAMMISRATYYRRCGKTYSAFRCSPFATRRPPPH